MIFCLAESAKGLAHPEFPAGSATCQQECDLRLTLMAGGNLAMEIQVPQRFGVCYMSGAELQLPSRC